MQQPYAYQDLSLQDRDGECWKPVSGFSDYYEISSQGRVKSLYREWILPHGGIRRKPEHILKQRVIGRYNKQASDYTYSLVAALFLESIVYSFSVARLVYDTFVAPLDLKDKSILITFKDGDSRNLDYRNLEASCSERIIKRSYERGRLYSETRKPISQFDPEGNLVATYTSLSEAGNKNGFDISTISAAVLNGNLYKGFLWQEGKGREFRKGTFQQRIDLGVNPNFQSDTTGMCRPALPAADLSPESRKGEEWRDFPGYEGLYQVSSMGRVKALGKISEGKQRKWFPERIKQLSFKRRNRTSGGPRPTLIVTLRKGGANKTYVVSRYVYYLFVAPFDLSDSGLRVGYKDGNPHNLDCRNLYLKNTAARTAL